MCCILKLIYSKMTQKDSLEKLEDLADMFGSYQSEK